MQDNEKLERKMRCTGESRWKKVKDSQFGEAIYIQNDGWNHSGYYQILQQRWIYDDGTDAGWHDVPVVQEV